MKAVPPYQCLTLNWNHHVNRLSPRTRLEPTRGRSPDVAKPPSGHTTDLPKGARRELPAKLRVCRQAPDGKPAMNWSKPPRTKNKPHRVTCQQTNAHKQPHVCNILTKCSPAGPSRPRAGAGRFATVGFEPTRRPRQRRTAVRIPRARTHIFVQEVSGARARGGRGGKAGPEAKVGRGRRGTGRGDEPQCFYGGAFPPVPW